MRTKRPQSPIFARFVLGVALVCLTGTAHGRSPQQTLASPVSLGPRYSGLLGAGAGLGGERPKFGMKAGEFVIQPRFFLEGAYSTNYFRADTRNEQDEELGVFATHLRPGLAIFNPGFDKVAFSMSVDIDALVPVSDNEAVTDQTDVGVEAMARATIGPKSTLTMTLDGRFSRELWTRPIVGSGAGADRNLLQTGADLSFHPGGRALDLTAGWTMDQLTYDDNEALNSDIHDFHFRTSWRFYPLSFLFLDSSLRMVTYPFEVTNEAKALPGNHVPGKPWKAYLGLSGYITDRMALMVRGGYGDTMLDSSLNEGFAGVVGEARLTFRFSERTVLHVGGARDFDLSVLGGHFEYFRGYASFEKILGSMARFHADFSLDFRTFGTYAPPPVAITTGGTITSTASTPNRDDVVLGAGMLVDFDLSRLFGATIGYRFDADFTDYSVISNIQATGEDPESIERFTGYADHRVFATFNLRY